MVTSTGLNTLSLGQRTLTPRYEDCASIYNTSDRSNTPKLIKPCSPFKKLTSPEANPSLVIMPFYNHDYDILILSHANTIPPAPILNTQHSTQKLTSTAMYKHAQQSSLSSHILYKNYTKDPLYTYQHVGSHEIPHPIGRAVRWEACAREGSA
jgi:hypothetical protein